MCGEHVQALRKGRLRALPDPKEYPFFLWWRPPVGIAFLVGRSGARDIMGQYVSANVHLT